MDLSHEKLIKAFTKTIAKNRTLDPISLAEELVDTLDLVMELSDTGYGVQPVRITGREEEGKVRRMPPPPAEEARAPEAPRSGMVLTPDDPQFQKAAEAARNEWSKGSIPAPARISQVGNPAGQAGDVQYWTPETLIASLEKNFPAQITFTPNKMPDHIKIVAVRNIQAQINAYPPHAARVTYSHESMNQDGIDVSTPVGDGQGKTNISLIASVLFTCNQQNIDVDSAMESIVEQLRGLYAPRPKIMEPGYIGENGMDSWNASNPGMKDSESIRGTRDWSMVDRPLDNFVDGMIRQNRQLGTPGR